MRERPIIFSAPMVRAILEGRKTQTRRAVKPQPPAGWDRNCWFSAPVWGWTAEAEPAQTWHKVRCPYGQPGDRLWVRETWQAIDGNERARRILTKPDPSRGWIEYAATVPKGHEPPPRWRPSIHMPRWASRITLEITDVRVERLQDISEEDAIAEGALEWARGACAPGNPTGFTAVGYFWLLWEPINGPGSWDANPWVWVIEFKKLEQA